MPGTTKLEAANLALVHVGEPLLSDYDTDTGTTADTVRLLFPQAVKSLLEEHNWSFAKASAQPAAANSYVTASLTINPAGDNNNITFTAVATGQSGNAITIEIATPASTLAVSVTGSAITITPDSSPASTAQQIIDAVNASSAASALVTASAGEALATGTVEAAIAAQNLAGGKMWQSAFLLPTDCVKLRTINDTDVDSPLLRWDLEGRYIMVQETGATPPVIEYTTDDVADDLTGWPSTFTEAFSLLLASKLAKTIQQSDQRAGNLFKEYLMALGKARSKDARESKSGENMTPRQLAARSGLVQARYNRTPPPY